MLVLLFEYVSVHSLPISFVFFLFGSDGWVLGCLVSVDILGLPLPFPLMRSLPSWVVAVLFYPHFFHHIYFLLLLPLLFFMFFFIPALSQDKTPSLITARLLVIRLIYYLVINVPLILYPSRPAPPSPVSLGTPKGSQYSSRSAY